MIQKARAFLLNSILLCIIFKEDNLTGISGTKKSTKTFFDDENGQE